MRIAGAVLLGLILLAACAAPWLAPNPPNRRFADLLYAPPTRIHVGDGSPAPHLHPLRIVSRLERRFDEDRATHVPLRWFSGGVLVSADPDSGAPLLLLGSDAFGRDRFSRLLYGSRATLALGGTRDAPCHGGWCARRRRCGLRRRPARYAPLARFRVRGRAAGDLRRARAPRSDAAGAPGSTIFVLLLTIFALLGWPMVARGVRAIVLVERDREYAMAARAAGASPTRLLTRHLLPAASGYLSTQASLLLPAFILAESTMSYVGLGFPDTTPTWGTMLQDASNVALLGDAPWALAPAAAIFMVVLGVNLLVQSTGHAPVQLER